MYMKNSISIKELLNSDIIALRDSAKLLAEKLPANVRLSMGSTPAFKDRAYLLPKNLDIIKPTPSFFSE